MATDRINSASLSDEDLTSLDLLTEDLGNASPIAAFLNDMSGRLRNGFDMTATYS